MTNNESTNPTLTKPIPANILFYSTPSETTRVAVQYEDETFWLAQKAMAELFDVEVNTINYHLKEIFKSGELDENSVIRKIRITANDGKNYLTKCYNLDVIIAVGYRVNSKEATQFRIWATQTLREFIIKGFVMDDDRLKQGKAFGKDYFDELVERIREIRASERRFYQKVTDIYALASDYNAKAPQTREFFASVQNKLHWAITGQTAAELIYNNANANKVNMGLTSWKHAPDGKILKSDVTIAKNYLNKAHISELEQLISAYLDLAENRAKRQIVTSMTEWSKFLEDFLTLSSCPILQDKGKISHAMAKIKAESEYDKFRVEQDRLYESDFDQYLDKYLDKLVGVTKK